MGGRKDIGPTERDRLAVPRMGGGVSSYRSLSRAANSAHRPIRANANTKLTSLATCIHPHPTVLTPARRRGFGSRPITGHGVQNLRTFEALFCDGEKYFEKTF